MSFSVRLGELVFRRKVASTFVLPGERLRIEAVSPRGGDRFHMMSGVEVVPGMDAWEWTAPAKPGLYPLTVQRVRNREAMLLNVFVMVPFEAQKKGGVNGYRIGTYPRGKPRDADIYDRPDGFVEVTRENEGTLVSPHFRLGQFLCKQGGGDPRYVVVREELVLKLEDLLERLNEKGIPAETLTVMSAYRTPHYNRAIGNGRWSVHQFGGAADVFVDLDGDGRMDDLNGDRLVNARDSRWLAEVVEELDEEASRAGGIGTYASNRAHGPFVHVDVRGFAARWGQPGERRARKTETPKRRRTKQERARGAERSRG